MRAGRGGPVTGLALLWEAAPKALLYAALLPALGACVARWRLLPRLSRRSGALGVRGR